MTRVAAVDIGGANIKGTDPEGESFIRPFRLGCHQHDLSSILSGVLEKLGDFDALGVTMTGEICDCFETRSEGVRHILASVKTAAIRGCPSIPAPGRKRRWPEVVVWRTDKRLVSVSEALGDPLPSAAANWLALATLAGRMAPEGSALLVDVGSTTTDIVPIEDGTPMPAALTDTERLLAGELIYSGVSRTAIPAIVTTFPYRGRMCPLARETFATTRDAYLILEKLEEAATDTNTADGQAATKEKALSRMARMICADSETFGRKDGREAAAYVMKEQIRLLQEALRKLQAHRKASFETAVISGAGEFLAREAMEREALRVVPVSETLGLETSRGATSYALWRLVSEQKGRERAGETP